jgi:hypothetical protein
MFIHDYVQNNDTIDTYVGMIFHPSLLKLPKP